MATPVLAVAVSHAPSTQAGVFPPAPTLLLLVALVLLANKTKITDVWLEGEEARQLGIW